MLLVLDRRFEHLVLAARVEVKKEGRTPTTTLAQLPFLSAPGDWHPNEALIAADEPRRTLPRNGGPGTA
jgi:hypothetical protein